MFFADLSFDDAWNSRSAQTLSSDVMSSALLFEPAILRVQKLSPKSQHRVIISNRDPSQGPGINSLDLHRQYRQDLGLNRRFTPTAYQPLMKQKLPTELGFSEHPSSVKLPL